VIDKTPTNIAAVANDRIWDFIHLRANARLRPGTGWYSTPFRGGLFGRAKSNEIAKSVSRLGVDVLWLGANPAVRESLKNILSWRAGGGHLPSFERQMKSGFFGSWKWTDAGAVPDWNPIDAPRGGWRTYHSLLGQVARLDRVAMANLIPWGSQDARTLLSRLDATEPNLLRRMLEFADDLNVEIVEALRPRLMFVPLSLARNRQLEAIHSLGVSLSQATEVSMHEVMLREGRFKFYTGITRRGRVMVPTVFIRHPASLRLSVRSRARLIRHVGSVVDRFQRLG
jgi:hypothetical protein